MSAVVAERHPEARCEEEAGGTAEPAADERCAECGDALGGGELVELTLPGETQKARLHCECRAAYEERRAPRCDHCSGAMPRRMVTLTQPSGAARVCPDCVDAFRLAAAPRCAHCGDAVTDEQRAEKGCATELRLPGEEQHALLHTACRAAYEDKHAPRCDQCGGAMAERMVVLPRACGDARVHPGCVDAFRAAGAPRCAHCGGAVTGVLSTLSDGTELHSACVAAYQRRVAPTCAGCGALIVGEPHTVISGRAYHNACATCAHCGDGFAAAEPVLEAELPPADGPAATIAALQSASSRGTAEQPGLGALRASLLRRVFLHTRCEEAHRAARAPRCAHCAEPMVGPFTRLWGEWGEARVHRGDCAAAFRRGLAGGDAEVAAAPAATPPWAALAPAGCGLSAVTTPPETPEEAPRSRATSAAAPVAPAFVTATAEAAGAPARVAGAGLRALRAAAPAADGVVALLAAQEAPAPPALPDQQPRCTEPRDVRVIGHDVGGKRTLFTIAFTAGGEQRSVSRYYSDFRALRTQIPRFAAPAFPGKTFFRCSGRALYDRQAKLDAWLRAAVAEEVGNAVSEFLDAGAPPASPSSVASPRPLATTA